MADRAPVADRHAAARGDVRDALVRDGIGLVEQALGGGLVGQVDRAGQPRQAALHPARRDGVAGARDAQRQRPAIGSQHRLQRRGRGRAVIVVRGVLLARPQQLHRPAAGLPRHRDGLRHEVGIEPAAEAAAQQRDVQRHRALVDAGGARRVRTGDAGHLGRRPHGDVAVADLRGAVDRFERGVREVGRAVERLDGACAWTRLALGRRHVAATAVVGEAAVVCERVTRRGLQRCRDGLRIDRAGRRRCPVDRQRLHRLAGMPAAARDHRDAGGGAGPWRQAHQPLHAGAAQHLVLVADTLRRAAEHRAHAHRGVQQALGPDVEAVDRAAVALGDDVGARRVAADQRPGGTRLQRHITGRRAGGRGGEFAEVRTLAGGVRHDAVAHYDLLLGQAPAQRGGTDQLGPHGGRGQPQRLPGVDDAGRRARHVDAELARQLGDDPLAALHGRRPAARFAVARVEGQRRDEGGHVAVDRVGAGLHQTHAVEADVELLGHQHRQRGVHALAHLAAVHRQRHAAVGGDLDPAVERHLAGLQRQQRAIAQPRARRQQRPAEQQAATGGRRAEQQRAALHGAGFGGGGATRGAAGGASAAAALWMAARTRG